MAYELTHVRFAHALHEHLGITDDAEYYAGSVYPDSRYVTGIPRDATHREGPQTPFDTALSDFERGWATHTLYDAASTAHWVRLGRVSGAIASWNPVWVERTSMKLLQDLDAVEEMRPHMGIVHSIGSTTRPRNEDAQLLGQYYGFIRELYASEPSFKDFESMWERFGGPDDVIRRVTIHAQEMQRDSDFVAEVHGAFDVVLQSALRGPSNHEHRIEVVYDKG